MSKMLTSLCLVAATLIPFAPASAAPEADAAKAAGLFKVAFEGRCADDAFLAETLDGTEGVSFTYRNTSDEPTAADSHATLYTFFCDRFHNSGSAAFVLKDNDGHFEVVSFAAPMSSFKEDPAKDGDLVVSGLKGLSTTDTLLNGEFSVETLTISSGTYEMGREYFATYRFVDGAFVFVEDETYRIKGSALVLDPRGTEEEP